MNETMSTVAPLSTHGDQLVEHGSNQLTRRSGDRLQHGVIRLSSRPGGGLRPTSSGHVRVRLRMAGAKGGAA